MKRYFTVAEANRQLSLIEPILISLQGLKREIANKHHHLKLAKTALGTLASSSSFFSEEAELEFLLIQADQAILKIREYGAEIKDVDRGLVDFHTKINGQEVCLCWQLGEPQIQYWHGIHEGFVGRKPLSLFE